MWEYYRRTFIQTQLLIVVICVGLVGYFKVPMLNLLVFIGVREMFSLLGAMWGARLKRKVEQAGGMLPGNRR